MPKKKPSQPTHQQTKGAHIAYLVKRMTSGKTLTGVEQKAVDRYITDGKISRRPSVRFKNAMAVSQHYGISPSMVSKALSLGRIVKNPNKSFNKSTTDAYWCGQLGHALKLIDGEPDPADTDTTIGNDEPLTISMQIDVERLRKLTADADAAELKVSQARGEVVAFVEVDLFWTKRVAQMRDQLISLWHRLPPLLVDQSHLQIQKIVEAEIRVALAAFAYVSWCTPSPDEAWPGPRNEDGRPIDAMPWIYYGVTVREYERQVAAAAVVVNDDDDTKGGGKNV